MIKFGFFLSMTLFVVCTSAYKTGAPEMACKALEPKHKDWKGQTTPSPYKIEAKKSGEYIEVKIADPKNEEKFKGFLLVAKDATGKTIGSWEEVEKAKLLKCENENDAITHKTNAEKDSILLKWKIPADLKGSVCFKGAVVKNGKTFWTGQKSNSVTI